MNPAEGIIRLGPLAARFLITGETPAAGLRFLSSLFHVRRAWRLPAHSHDHYGETIYGIEGVFTRTVYGKQIEVGPARALCISRGAVYGFVNNRRQGVKALCVITLAAIGQQYFRESAQVINAACPGRRIA